MTITVPSVKLPKLYPVKPDQLRLNVLFYGDPGSGKTSLAAQAQDHPAMRDVLILNIEGGLLSVVSRGDLYAMDIQTVQELEAVFWELKKGEDGDLGNINTLIIDSGSELQTLNLEEIVHEAVRDKDKRTDVDDVWLEDYKKSGTQLKRLFRWYRDLPVNVIITALARFEYPKSGKMGVNRDRDPKEVKPQFTRAVCDSVMGYVDFCWYMFQQPELDEDGEPTGRKFRYLLTEDEEPFRAKTRGPSFKKALGKYVRIKDLNDPKDDGYTLPEIYDLLIESETA